MKKVGTPTLARTPAKAVEVMARRKVGAHTVQCITPRETERPIRTWSNVIHTTTSRHVCLMDMASHSLTVELAS